MGKKIVLDALGREMVVEENEELRPEPERDNRWLKIYIYEEDNGNKKYYIEYNKKYQIQNDPKHTFFFFFFP